MLSICLPVYNGQRYLRAAVESLLSQTFSDFELVICDNASADATESICRELAARDSRIRYYRNARNLGAAPNFNRAADLARGQYVRWASHDDLWAPTAMQRCIEVLERDPTVICCHGRTVVIDEHGQPVPTYDDSRMPAPSPRHVPQRLLYDPPRQLDSDHPAERLRDLLLHTHWCFEIFGIIRRSQLLRTSLHGSYYGSDKVLLAELAMMGRTVVLDEPLFFRRDHAGNSTSIRTHRERAEWMDTSLNGKLRRPHLKLLAGYHRAIRRGEGTMAQKLGCYRVLAAWMMQFRKFKNVVRESDQENTAPDLPAGVAVKQ